MTENLPAEPTPQKVAAQNRSAPRRVTGKLKIAIERMVWVGDKRADAATAAGLTDHGLRAALRKPHVLGYLRSELALLREGERPRNVHRLAELRDQDENRNAAVKAIQVLEQLTENAPQYVPRHGAMFQIVIVQPATNQVIQTIPPAPAPKVIDADPINAHERELEDGDR